MWVPQAPVVPQVPRSAIHSLVIPSKRVSWKKITITYIKERLPKEGYSTLVRQRVWKAFKFESVRRVIIIVQVHLHIIVVKVLHKMLIAMWPYRSGVKIILDKNSINVPLLWLTWLTWTLIQANFRVRDRKYLSVGFIFRMSETLMVFRGG